MHPRSHHFAALVAAAALLALPQLGVADDAPIIFLGTDTIVTSDVQTDCNFNGTAIPCPNYIWFIAVGKLSTPALAPITIYIQNQHIQFTANSVNYDLLVPDGATTFDGSATTASAVFTGANTWDTTVPLGASGNQFWAALAWPVPCPDGLPGSIHNVAWTASFFANKPGASIQWTWSAAVYTSFSSAYNALGVKSTDDNSYPLYTNSDHAGTPENFKSFVTGGATGGGGSNYTGSLCSTHAVPDLPVPVLQHGTWGRIKTLYR
jgi:hypothetical protein